MKLPWLNMMQSADEYLQHAYEIPNELPDLPLPDEVFVSKWQEAQGRDVPGFWAGELSLAVSSLAWQEIDALKISFY